jgi:flagellar export protein FliJ
MKAFRFRLESVLTMRTREEDRAREACAAALRNQSAVIASIATANGELEACHAAIARQRAGRTNRTEQILLLSALQQQQSHCERLLIRRAAADRDVAARRAELMAARRKREPLSNLKERQRLAHRLEMERRQEATISDIISARHVLSMREQQT